MPDNKSPQESKQIFCKYFQKYALKIFLCLRYYIDILIDKIFSLYYDLEIAQIPKLTKSPLIGESAMSLARKIQKRQTTVEEVVMAFIERIKDVNRVLNAVIDERFDAALEEARTLDRDIAIGHIQEVDFQTRPFLGVPFTSKESTACKGLSHTFGLVSRKGKKSTFDADVVERMKRAGGVLLGVTNIPQLNLWQETSNPLFGVTKNPYNPTRNVGGSSGGEASIIAAGGSPLGIGTDIGGSLRIPAFMCGIFGHKPTCDLISTCGLTFRTGKEKDTMVVAGPMTRHVEDIIPVLKVLVQPEKLEKLRLDEEVPLANLKILYISNPKDPFVSPFRQDTIQTFRKVVEHFNRILPENRLEELNVPELKWGGKIWRYWMSQEPNANFNYDLTDREGEVQSWKEICNYFMGNSHFTLAVILMLINGLLPKENVVWAKEVTNTLREKLINKLGSDGILLYPSAPWPANYHHTALLRPWNFNLFSVWNALKFPVTQVPLGLSKEGLPMGIQVISAPYNDRLCIAVAKELEDVFGGYVPPFKVHS